MQVSCFVETKNNSEWGLCAWGKQGVRARYLSTLMAVRLSMDAVHARTSEATHASHSRSLNSQPPITCGQERKLVRWKSLKYWTSFFMPVESARGSSSWTKKYSFVMSNNCPKWTLVDHSKRKKMTIIGRLPAQKTQIKDILYWTLWFPVLNFSISRQNPK